MGAYPIITFPDIPKIDVLMLPRQDQPPLGVANPHQSQRRGDCQRHLRRDRRRFRELPFTPSEFSGDCGVKRVQHPARLAGSGAQSPQLLPINGKIRLLAGAVR